MTTELSEFTMRDEIQKIHALCDKAGIPQNDLPYPRVLYYVLVAEKWMDFLEFMGYDVRKPEPEEAHEEKVLHVDIKVIDTGNGISSGGNADASPVLAKVGEDG